jgi:hypothetical protein
MKILEEKNYSIETKVIVIDSESKLTEDLVKKFYEERGYNVYDNYSKDVVLYTNDRSIFSQNNIKELKPELISLFKENPSGFPDLLLIKNGEIEFIEIKLERDGLAYNQLKFLEKLSNIYKTSVVKFYNTNLNPYKELDLDSIILKYKAKADQNNYKPYWIVAQLYRSLKGKIFLDNNLKKISKIIKLDEDKIKFFIDKNKYSILENKDKSKDKRFNKKEVRKATSKARSKRRKAVKNNKIINNAIKL